MNCIPLPGTEARQREEAALTLRAELIDPKARLALKGNIVGAISSLATLVALLVHADRLDLAAPLLGLIGYLILIRAQIGD